MATMATSSSSQPSTARAQQMQSTPVPQPAKKRRSFDTALKLKVIEYAELHTNREAGRKFSIGESCVREWRKNKDKLKEQTSKRLRLIGGGRKAKAPSMEDALTTWIDDQRSAHIRVTRSGIQRRALELYQGDGEFSASRGWLENFLKRKGFSLRRRTTTSQRLPQDFIVKVSSFVLRIRRLRIANKYPLAMIGNMDETPLWLDMPGDTTVSRVGERTISIRTTGHDKGRFTVILAAMADGRKLPPFVVFKGVRPIAELDRVQGVVVVMSRNGWMNEDLTIQWLDRVWGRFSFQKRLLVWDAFRQV